MHKPRRERRRRGRKRRKRPPVPENGSVYDWVAMVDHYRRAKCLRGARCRDPERKCARNNQNAIRVTLARALALRGDIPWEILKDYDGSHTYPFFYANEGNPHAAPAYTLSGLGLSPTRRPS